jgi:exopolysaccharide biosynthesis operon protein EpsL
VDWGEILLPEADGTGERRNGTRNGWLRCSKYWLPSLLAVVLVAGLAPSTAAYALWGDRLELFAAQGLTRDDNVFRISSQSDPATDLGTSSKDDVYHTTSFGFNLDLPVSRQRFLGGVAWDDRRYDRFSVLNFTGRHGRAVWQWQAGNELSGELGHRQTRALASLANVQSGVQSSTPNPLETHRTHINATYLLTPRWQLRGELSRLDQSNEVPALQVNDIRLDAVDLTVTYATPARNQIALGLQLANGDLPNPFPVAGSLVDNSYQQRGVNLATAWTITGKSHVSVQTGWVDRSYAQLPQREFEGAEFHVQYDWQPTGKLALTALAQRRISTVEEINVGFVRVKGVALRPMLRPTEKIQVSAELEYSDRDYLGDPGLVLGTVPARTDRVRSAGLMVHYRPMRTVTFDMALRRETRSSTAAFGDYVANIFSASVRVGF